MKLQELILGGECDFDLGGGMGLERGRLLKINGNKYTVQYLKKPEVRYIGQASIRYHTEESREGEPIIYFREWTVDIKKNQNKEINTKWQQVITKKC